MMFTFYVIVGACSAGVFTVVARALDREQVMYGIALILAAFWYVSLDVMAGKGVAVSPVQIGICLFFVILAVIGLWKSFALIGVGWILHVVWDVMMHSADGDPILHWGVPLCIGFDLVLGSYILHRARTIRLSSPVRGRS
ncbi:MAG: DUF6010 family protein [Pseudomonadota bacterium]